MPVLGQLVTGIKCLDFDDGIRNRAGKVFFEAKISAGNIKYMDLFLMGKGGDRLTLIP